MAVHNEIVRRAPHLARELARRGAWYFDRKGEVPDRSNGLVRTGIGNMSTLIHSCIGLLSDTEPVIP